MNDTLRATQLVLVLVLAVGALVARRYPLKSMAKLALAWVGIFAVGLLIVAAVSRAEWLTSGARALLYGRGQGVTGGQVRIPMADDGHFYVTARINGVERSLLVDSGATDTALSVATATASHIDLGADGRVEMLETANGTVMARRATIERLQIGPIDAVDVPVAVAPEFGEADVLGMSFLSRLKSWKVEGRELVMTPETR